MTVTPGHIQFYFNPQGSREPRQYPFLADTVIRMISIHKALASLDFRAKTLYIQGKRFQSTRLSRASTEDYAKVIGNIYISIHKALASLDTNALYHHESVVQNFNPQGSREPRRGCTKGTRLCLIFQSTRLSRASTCDITCGRINSVISIHKALASLDKLLLTCDASVCNFNPQGSREPRHSWQRLLLLNSHISIHKALASLDSDCAPSPYSIPISIHKALASLDTCLF